MNAPSPKLTRRVLLASLLPWMGAIVGIVAGLWSRRSRASVEIKRWSLKPNGPTFDPRYRRVWLVEHGFVFCVPLRSINFNDRFYLEQPAMDHATSPPKFRHGSRMMIATCSAYRDAQGVWTVVAIMEIDRNVYHLDLV